MSKLFTGTFLIVILSSASLFGQAYKDALLLDSLVIRDTFRLENADTARLVAEIMQDYMKFNPGANRSVNTVLTGLSAESEQNINYNPILEPLIDFGGGSSSGNLPLNPRAGFSPATSGGIGGLSVTNLADGLARFLVDRTKQELNQAFFRKFVKAIQDPKFFQLQILYPNTLQTIEGVGNDIYRYAYFMESLRESFRKDMKAMPTNLAKLLNAKQLKPYFAPTERVILQLALAMVQLLLEDEMQAIPALNTLANSPYWNETDSLQNLHAAFQVTDLLAKGLKSEDGWATRQEIEDLFTANNGLGLKIFCGILFQQGANIYFQKKDGSKETFREILKELDQAGDEFQLIRNYIDQFSGYARDMQRYHKQIQEDKENGVQTTDDYYGFFSSFLSALDEGIYFKQEVLNDTSSFDARFSLLLKLLNDFNLDIRLRNYNSAVVNMVMAIQTAIGDEEFPHKAEILRYSSFIASVAKAETSEEVAQAIEAVALPVGSSAIKKYSTFNLSLGAYVGGFYGQETLNNDVLNGTGLQIKNPVDKVYGLTAPVGLSVSFGINRLKDWGAATFFFSLIDVGAITAFRFEDDTTSHLPNITLQNIYAPGIHLIYGLPKVPISIGFGWQKGPQLRQVSTNMNTIIDARGYRWAGFIAVDIPLFNLYTSPK